MKKYHLFLAIPPNLKISGEKKGAFCHAPFDKHRPAVPFGSFVAVLFRKLGAVFGAKFKFCLC